MSKQLGLQHPPRVQRVCTRIITLAGAVNGTSKNLGLGKFWQHLEIIIGSVFDKSLSLVFALFVFTFFVLKLFTKESWARIIFELRSWRLGEFQILPFTTPTCHPVTVEWFPIQTLVNFIPRVLS